MTILKMLSVQMMFWQSRSIVVESGTHVPTGSSDVNSARSPGHKSTNPPECNLLSPLQLPYSCTL